MTPTEQQMAAATALGSPAKAWLRALDLTAPIAANPRRILSTVIDEMAERQGNAPALLSRRECLTYRELAARSNQYTRWALAQGLGKGDAVCLLMENRPEYMAIWLGISRAGCAVALLNTNVTGDSLSHCIDIVAPKYLIASASLVEKLIFGRELSCLPKVWVHGAGYHLYDRIDIDVERYSGQALRVCETVPVTTGDRALYLYTSGTTGLPKAANISHARLMQWSLWFAGMMNTGPADRLYNSLPMYHSVGGVLATGSVLASGGSIVIRDRFSASRFWSEIVEFECTLFQYIGELCRYLLHTPAHPAESLHRIRICCGNGLRPDIWEAFKSRFGIPRILEFYAATEGNVSMFNVEGKPGAIGRVPPWLAHRFGAALVRVDVEKEAPARNADGFCIPSDTDETGEALGRIREDTSNPGNRFEGYKSDSDSRAKVLRNVFEPGDAWFRTGDLMRKDAQGYFYFIDRLGDTFRWKGENVATSEVAEAICAFPGVREAIVYGVAVPACDGRAGMAVVSGIGELMLAQLRAHLRRSLPGYAQPLFLRLRHDMAVTETFKYTKGALVREGYDPAAIGDALYFDDRERGAFVPLDAGLYERIQTGQLRL